MSYALRADAASFERDGRILVAPFSLAVAGGGDADLEAPGARAATILARMCAAIVKPTRGTVYVGDFETRLQPPQATRLVGYVDAAGYVGDAHAFRCEVAFRADVWGLDHHAAAERANAVAAALAPLGADAFARAVALALVAEVRLVVLNQPPLASLDAIRALVPDAGIVAVRVASAVATDVRVASNSAR